ncbi:MAG: hypothetical protein AAB459_03575 [Patescibacteria group bacterium]
MRKPYAQSGFAHIWLILSVVISITLVTFVAFRVLYKKNGASSNPISNLANKITGSGKNENDESHGWLNKCETNDRKPMTRLPMNMSDVASFTPYGITAGAHVTPIDHLYFYPKDSPRDKYPVFAMADGYIVEIGSRGVQVDTGNARPPEYRIIFQHSCQTVSYFDLVTKLDDSIKKEIGELKPNDSKGNLRIPVKAGQEIGRIGAQSLDTAVYNFSMTLPGFISPKLYKAEFWKVHTDDFFSYFSQTDQDQMQAKNSRKVKPYSGKIDYDQPGKLIGNWFKQGTNGYAGPDENMGKPAENGRGYWSGHLAVFYDAIDPTTIIVSLGDYNGLPKSFAVKGNSPDPASVSKDSGVTKYELVTQVNRLSPTGGVSVPSTQVLGVVLFEVLEGEKLKIEIFPDKTGNQVSGFTSAALTYER